MRDKIASALTMIAIYIILGIITNSLVQNGYENYCDDEYNDNWAVVVFWPLIAVSYALDGLSYTCEATTK